MTTPPPTSHLPHGRLTWSKCRNAARAIQTHGIGPATPLGVSLAVSRLIAGGVVPLVAGERVPDEGGLDVPCRLVGGRA